MTPLPSAPRRWWGQVRAVVGVTLAATASVLAEALCPVIVMVALYDATSFTGWVAYGRDAGIYATVARFWQQGMMPYRDIYDFKPPLIFIALRAAFALWDYHPESLRRVLLGVATAGSLMMYIGLRRSGAVIAAPLAALGLMTLIVPDSASPPMQNTELLVAAFTAAAIGCTAAHERAAAWGWALAAGACVGLATLAKQPGVFFGLPVVVALALFSGSGTRRSRLRRALGHSLLAAAGFAGVIAAVALYFAWRGAWRALYEAVLVDGSRYAGVQLSSVLTPNGFKQFVQARGPGAFQAWVGTNPAWPFIWAVAALVPVTLVVPSRRVLIAWSWLFAGYLGVIAGPLGDPHYIILAYPSFALVLGLVFQLTLENLPGPTWNARRLLVETSVLAVLLFGERWQTVYRQLRAVAPAYVPTDPAEVIGQRIRQAAEPGDTLLVLDEPFSIYVYAGVSPVSRFIYYNAPNPLALATFEKPLEGRPTFVFLGPHSVERLRRGEAGKDPEFALLLQALTANYQELFQSADGGKVYQRRDGVSRSPSTPRSLRTHD